MTDYSKISWISNDRSKPDAHILCHVCDGIIVFSRDEVARQKAKGGNTSTRCQYCKWHPSWPAEPWLPYPEVKEPAGEISKIGEKPLSEVKAEEAIKQHYSGDCVGKPVVEYEDADGKHWHCALCGYWRTEKA